MIRSFKDKNTDKIFNGLYIRAFSPEIARKAKMKLQRLHAAVNLDDLIEPKSNHLEKLSGKRLGQYSIRINDQWRICFIWNDGNAYDVEIVDYH